MNIKIRRKNHLSFITFDFYDDNTKTITFERQLTNRSYKIKSWQQWELLLATIIGNGWMRISFCHNKSVYTKNMEI